MSHKIGHQARFDMGDETAHRNKKLKRKNPKFFAGFPSNLNRNCDLLNSICYGPIPGSVNLESYKVANAITHKALKYLQILLTF